ncbi:hypothetical protein [Tautonia marina]|uniref:hypothetical protein n=1 Tax=Tautonia marina TaxID=2653855 RepID=UPI001260484D|nr:hypothetical protein [Tautonia marina]
MSTIPSFSTTDIPDHWSRIVNAIVDAQVAWSTPDDLVSATGIDEESVIDALADMDVDGLIDVWERPDELVVTLSVLAAERFGYHLIETGPPLMLRWARAGEPEPEPPKSTQVLRSASMAPFLALIDPHPGPEVEVETNEQAERYQANGHFGTFRRGAGRGEPPHPTLLLGTNVNGWSGDSVEGPETCPACHSRPLPAYAYCLCCDRWGLDAPNPVPSSARGRTWEAASRNPGGARINPTDRRDRARKAHQPPLVRLRKEHERRERLIHREQRRNQRPA